MWLIIKINQLGLGSIVNENLCQMPVDIVRNKLKWVCETWIDFISQTIRQRFFTHPFIHEIKILQCAS